MIKKIIKFLPIFAMCISTVYADHSKKTFLLPRPQGVNLAMELSTWHDHVFTHATNHKNSHIQTTIFGQAGIRGSETGEYFGIGNGKNSFSVGNAFNSTTEVANWYLIHNSSASEEVGTNVPSGKIILNPKQEAYGIRLDWYQFLNHPFKNLFFKVSLPVVYVENDLHLRVDESVADANGNTLTEFFKGKRINQPEVDANGEFVNSQNKLEHAKMSGRKAVFGLADADICLGYRLLEKEKKHCNLYVALTAPTGNRVRGEWLFEPVYGNGRHVALGWGIDASAQLWKKERHSGRVIFALNHRYLFDGTERRTIPIKSKQYPFAHYYLAGRIDQEIGTPLFPAANILTRKMTVRPGNQLDSILALSFKSKRFLVDLGYNLFYKESEAIRLKHKWRDNVYGVAGSAYQTSDQFTAAEALFPINKSKLNIKGAATPSQVTHKAFGSLGYKFDIDKKYPTSLSAGASYEFAGSNSALEGYAFWGKFAISF